MNKMDEVMPLYSDQQIVNSWSKNVKAWVAAIHNGEIESRLLITNKSIVQTVVNKAPENVLDVGCGEGWLVRELMKYGINSLGIDVIPELIEYAKKTGGGRFRALSYDKLLDNMAGEKFDMIVCNFSLLGKESVDRLFQQAASVLKPGGSLIVQTLHPVITGTEKNSEDGWREGSWAGFNQTFCDPAPWYFRTLETWKILFAENSFEISEMLEPLNPKTQLPASIIFTGSLMLDR